MSYRSMPFRLFITVIVTTAWASIAALGRQTAVMPKITGPIPSSAAPGDPSRNYPYFTTSHLVSKYGYVEEEFYVEGFAVAYLGGADQTASVAPGGPYPYKTRVIVRRPKSGKFNGTVILEWNNVSARRDIENDWYWSHDHFMQRGFVHIGVSAQGAGIDSEIGLKRWNPTRYGSLNVTANGKFTNGELSFSIFSQVARAAKSPSEAALLGNLKVKNVIATGHSASAGRLFQYYNRIQPLEGIVDGFVLHGAGGVVRTDIRTPAWKLLAEADVVQRQGAIRQPDSSYLRTWEVAGAAHADWDLISFMQKLETRDMTIVPEEQRCERPELSRVPARLVQHSLYDWMKLWIERGTAPPQAPPIRLSSVGTPQNPVSVAERDEHGNALGGIRLAQFTVATATNTGLNTGPGACFNFGSHEPFDALTLARLYPARRKYTSEIQRITDANLKDGYITKEGAAQTQRDAARWKPAAGTK